jgi:hypothetical protein
MGCLGIVMRGVDPLTSAALELIDDHLKCLGFSIPDPPMHHVSPCPKVRSKSQYGCS